ncbi:signal peptidase I [Staphylospora marina]|uniref:signal peptidase I n=1 Tax=Staphylospora marina TaxID=2490858 RepID=UPI000F5BE52C|nr:signal peptidase I [Staphylospora marina]
MADTKNSLREWSVAIVSAVAISFVIRFFLFTPYEVHGASMEPTLKGDELLIVNQWIYKVKKPEYGDIIVFKNKEENRDFIKRVIGLPGDVIEFKGGEVYRNGQLLDEPYIIESAKHRQNHGEQRREVVPPGKLYVMGDNRLNSKDSRTIGPISMEEVIGRADVVILPVKEMRLLTKQK